MITIDEQVKYWVNGAERDYATMEVLLTSKRYPESLFFGHIVLEKMLKAFVVLETKEQPPKIHDLSYLAKLANLDLEKDVLDYFELVNKFNIRARYDDYKKAFYETCTKEYTEVNFQRITEAYKKLCQKMTQKRS
ncbi:MAG: HEPN domain-containing protein [Candidatus Taylorbacteria bacterium]|nr:HEPN domain-containing protein [Candidatus Taylorbacteria bacterium]